MFSANARRTRRDVGAIATERSPISGAKFGQCRSTRRPGATACLRRALQEGERQRSAAAPSRSPDIVFRRGQLRIACRVVVAGARARARASIAIARVLQGVVVAFGCGVGLVVIGVSVCLTGAWSIQSSHAPPSRAEVASAGQGVESAGHHRPRGANGARERERGSAARRPPPGRGAVPEGASTQAPGARGTHAIRWRTPPPTSRRGGGRALYGRKTQHRVGWDSELVECRSKASAGGG